MRERTLLERLRDPRLEARRADRDDLGALSDSILRHLRCMLNTRQGNAQTVPDYGMPDLMAYVRDFPESTGAIESAICRSVELYEPRLRSVSVRHRDSDRGPFALSFEITAELATAEGAAGVVFVTEIDSAGKVEVSG